MSALTEITSDGLQRILAHNIHGSRGLLKHLYLKASFDESVTVEQLQQEAVRQGLYRLLGKRYALALSSMIALAEDAILHRQINSDDELAIFLEGAAASLNRFDRGDKALRDLRIDARQKGLYTLIERRDTHEGKTGSEERSYDTVGA